MGKKPRAELRPEDVIALIDTREQCAWDLAPLRSEPATLTTGDVTIKGLEHLVACERKELSDYIACCGRERERFQRDRCATIEA